MIRDAWLVLIVVAVSQSIPGTWGAMMVVVLQVITISITVIIRIALIIIIGHHHHCDAHQTLNVDGKSLTEEWIDVLAVTASFLCNCVAIIGARYYIKGWW